MQPLKLILVKKLRHLKPRYVLQTCYDHGGMLQFAGYLKTVIYNSSSLALARDLAIATGVIYNCNTFMVHATAEINSYHCKLQS
jgi:hypothetical protein